MKKSLVFTASFIAFIALLLVSCATPQKSFERGNYEESIDLAVKKMRSNKVKERDIATLVEAFNYINQRETARLGRLRLDNNPENYDEMFDLAKRIQHRQELVQPFLALDEAKYYGLLSNIKWTDGINASLSEAREGASAHLYKQANIKLDAAKNGNRRIAREAYDAFKNIGKYDENYKNARELAEEAYVLGINHVYIKIENDSRTFLPTAFERELQSIFVRDLNSKWIKYHTFKEENLRYDYTIIARMTQINISPEGERRDHHIEEKQIEDGSEYVLDERGNVRKDSLGNDVKKIHYTWIRADVFDIMQKKDARVFGYLEYFDNRTTEKVLSRPLETIVHFENHAIYFDGDRRALTAETTRRLGGQAMPFPSDSDLLSTAAERLKDNAKQLIKDNDYIVAR